MDIFVAEKYAGESYHVEAELQERAQVLQDKLKRFGVNGNVTAIKRGPVVTLFEYQPDVDTKLSKIIALEDDLAMALQAMSIRIIAPIPGRSVVGFEVSNTTRHDVLFSQIINQPGYTQFSGSLPLVLGKGTIGEVVVVDLARMPHLLIAGSTGSGKSVGSLNLDFFQMPRPFKCAEVNVSDAFNFDVVKRQSTLDMNCAITVLKIGSAEIAGVAVQSDTKLCATSGFGKFNVYIVAVNCFLEQLDRLFRT